MLKPHRFRSDGLPTFCQTCLNQRASLFAKENVHNHDGIPHQNIFGSDLILINKEPLFVGHWARSGLLKIGDNGTIIQIPGNPGILFLTV